MNRDEVRSNPMESKARSNRTELALMGFIMLISMLGPLPIAAQLDGYLGFSNMWLVMAITVVVIASHNRSTKKPLIGAIPTEDILFAGYLITGVIVTTVAGRMGDALARLTSELLSISILIMLFRRAFCVAGIYSADLLQKALIVPAIMQSILSLASLILGIIAPDRATSPISFYLASYRFQRLMGIYGNPNTLGMMSLVGLLSLMLSFPYKKHLYIRIIFGIPMFLCIIFSQSRSSLISSSVVLLSEINILMVFIPLMIPSIFHKARDFVVNYLTSREGASDLLMTRFSGWSGRVFPMINYNPGGYGWRMDAVSASKIESFYFAVILQTGIIGAIFLFGWIFSKILKLVIIIINSLKEGMKSDSAFYIRILLVLIALLIHGFAESPLAAGSSAIRQLFFICIACYAIIHIFLTDIIIYDTEIG